MISDLQSRAAGTLANGDSDDCEAFGELVRRYQDAAFGCAYTILKEPAAAEDATQAAFLAAWLHRNDLRDPLAFGGWLRTIVRTECFRIVRRNRWPTVPLEEIPPIAAQPIPDELGSAELRAVLLDAITTLPESARTVIVLRYMSDLSYQEMAEFLEVPVSTVKKRLHDARKRLLAWFTHATGKRARHILSEYRPSRDARLENRIMSVATFLDKVMQGDVSAVAAALEAQPESHTGRLGTIRRVSRACRFPEGFHGVKLIPEVT